MGKITCLESRRRLLTQPDVKDEELDAHLTECSACSGFRENLMAQDKALLKALSVEVPDGLQGRILLAQQMGEKQLAWRQPRWLAAAASVLLVLGALVFTLQIKPSSGLDILLVSHVEEEIQYLNKDNDVRLVDLNLMLKRYGIRINEDIGHVRFAANCLIGSKVGAHIILDGENAPVTVFFIPDREVDGTMKFDFDQYKGVVMSTEKGSLALVSEDGASLKLAEHKLMSAMTYYI